MERSRPEKMAPLYFNDGTKIYVEASGAATSGGRALASLSSDVEHKFTSVAHVITNIAAEVSEAVKSATPHETELEFSLGIKIEPDGVSTMFVKGEASADLKVKLKWVKASEKPVA